jgi:hypothetical protein
MMVHAGRLAGGRTAQEKSWRERANAMPWPPERGRPHGMESLGIFPTHGVGGDQHVRRLVAMGLSRHLPDRARVTPQHPVLDPGAAQQLDI